MAVFACKTWKKLAKKILIVEFSVKKVAQLLFQSGRSNFHGDIHLPIGSPHRQINDISSWATNRLLSGFTLLSPVKVSINDNLEPPVKSWFYVFQRAFVKSFGFGLNQVILNESPWMDTSTSFTPASCWPNDYSWIPLNHFADWRHNRRRCRWPQGWRSQSSSLPCPPTCIALAGERK